MIYNNVQYIEHCYKSSKICIIFTLYDFYAIIFFIDVFTIALVFLKQYIFINTFLQGGINMQGRPSVLDRLESFASYGVTSAKLRLWDKQRNQLENDGFEVCVLAATGRKGENFCLIDWRNPTAQTAYEMLAISINAMYMAS